MKTLPNGDSSEMRILVGVLESARTAAQGDSSQFSGWPREVSAAGMDSRVYSICG